MEWYASTFLLAVTPSDARERNVSRELPLRVSALFDTTFWKEKLHSLACAKRDGVIARTGRVVYPSVALRSDTPLSLAT